MKKKNEAISTIVTITIIATVAVVTAAAAVAYIFYDKFLKLRAISYDPDTEEDMFAESAETLKTMIVSDEEEELSAACCPVCTECGECGRVPEKDYGDLQTESDSDNSEGNADASESTDA